MYKFFEEQRIAFKITLNSMQDKNLQSSQTLAKAMGWSPEPDSKALLLKTTLTYEHIRIKTRSFTPLISIYGIGGYSVCYQRKEVTINITQSQSL